MHDLNVEFIQSVLFRHLKQAPSNNIAISETKYSEL